jgi:hypothetical protein
MLHSHELTSEDDLQILSALYALMLVCKDAESVYRTGADLCRDMLLERRLTGLAAERRRFAQALGEELRELGEAEDFLLSTYDRDDAFVRTVRSLEQTLDDNTTARLVADCMKVELSLLANFDRALARRFPRHLIGLMGRQRDAVAAAVAILERYAAVSHAA